MIILVIQEFFYILLFVFVVYYAKKILKNLRYWSVRKIDYIKSWPLVGSFGLHVFQRTSFIDNLQRFYNKFPDVKVFGLFHFNNPVLVIRDPEIIRLITIKQFENFTDHTVIITGDMDPLFGRNLVSLTGYKWKHMRSTLSPAFTSSKMKTMYEFINECAENFCEYFQNEIKKQNKTIDVEMKDVFARYTNDVIASTAFGIKCDSMNDKTNEFFMTGKKCTNFSTGSLIKVFGYLYLMPVMKFFKIKIFGNKVDNFFRNIIRKNVEEREEEGIIRRDMIYLLMEARKGQLKHEDDDQNDKNVGFATVEESDIGKNQYKGKTLTIDDITAQAVLFFLAGYETSSTVMSFLIYELAINPDIQQRLQEEIDDVFANCNGTINYEMLLDMTYLDMVISECLRKWPPSMINERKCSKAYSLELNNRRLRIDKGTTIWMPVYCLHRDERYFPNPTKFDPERFNDENKNKIIPFTYFPFGAGPRNCIGSRFALLELKALCVHLLYKFDVVVTAKTQIPLKINRRQFNMLPEQGFWLGLKFRK